MCHIYLFHSVRKIVKWNPIYSYIIITSTFLNNAFQVQLSSISHYLIEIRFKISSTASLNRVYIQTDTLYMYMLIHFILIVAHPTYLCRWHTTWTLGRNLNVASHTHTHTLDTPKRKRGISKIPISIYLSLLLSAARGGNY